MIVNQMEEERIKTESEIQLREKLKNSTKPR